MTIDAGELDQRVVLQSKVLTADALNGQVVTWAQEGEVWAKVSKITGRTVHIANQMQGVMVMEVEIRKGPLPVARTWRALWKQAPGVETPLSIEAVVPNEDRDGWLLVCAEGIHDGR